jgi:DNA-binding LacI/PurR family transcriptional regulator
LVKRRNQYTIRDIARLAGVSRSTISLAINDSPRINADTKKRVLELIAEVGYRPNQAARSLASRVSKTILVILPEMDQAFSDGYFSECLSGILDASAFHEYHLMVHSATDVLKRENRPLKLFRQHTIDGVLAVGSSPADDYLAELQAEGCPVVVVNSRLRGIPSVAGDIVHAVQAAIAHLRSLGHTRIAHIVGTPDSWEVTQKTAGYLNARATHRLDCTETLIARAGTSAQSGHEAMRQLLARHPDLTAVFCATDMLAVGAMQAISGAGLQVPQDIAVFGGDNSLAGRFVSPQLSTIDPCMYTVGQTACEKLVNWLQTGTRSASHTSIPLPLMVRRSCGAHASSQSPEQDAAYAI